MALGYRDAVVVVEKNNAEVPVAQPVQTYVAPARLAIARSRLYRTGYVAPIIDSRRRRFARFVGRRAADLFDADRRQKTKMAPLSVGIANNLKVDYFVRIYRSPAKSAISTSPKPKSRRYRRCSYQPKWRHHHAAQRFCQRNGSAQRPTKIDRSRLQRRLCGKRIRRRRHSAPYFGVTAYGVKSNAGWTGPVKIESTRLKQTLIND